MAGDAPVSDASLDKDGTPAIGAGRKPRPSSPMAGRSLYLLTLFSIGFLVLVSFSFHRRQQDVKACAMSFMYPAYRRLHGFDLEHTRFAPKYSLYLYREQTIDLSDEPHGVPVLFVPGNAGSYKQIRPIAAEAAAQFQQSLKDDVEILRLGKRSLDFFTVDFNEDFSAFHGQTMLDQAEYLNSAITYILSLYTDARKSPSDKSLPDPTSVIIIGHSMGGIVARLTRMMPNYLPKSINTIITMSTPHAIPPAPFDPQIQRIYEDINQFWHTSFSDRSEGNPLQDLALISIAGGGLDMIVSSDYTSIRTIVPPSNGFTVYTSTIPNVWISADHQAILWCDQFRKVLARALLETVDARRGSQTKTLTQRMNIFREHLLSKLERAQFQATLANQQRHTIHLLSQTAGTDYRIVRGTGMYRTANDLVSGSFDMIPLADTVNSSLQLLTNIDSRHDRGGQLAISMCRQESTSFRSDMGDDLELSCIDVTKDLITLPSRYDLKRFGSDMRTYFLQYEAASLLGHDFLSIQAQSEAHDSFVAVELVAPSASSEVHTTISMFNLFFGGIRIILSPTRALSSVVKIDSIVSSMIAYKLQLFQGCPNRRMEAVTRQYTAAPYESKFHIGSEIIDVSIHGQAPFFPPVYTKDQGLTIQHWADPACDGQVDIALTVDYVGSLGKLVMRYRIVLVVFPLAMALLVSMLQMKAYNQTGHFLSYQQGLRIFVQRILLSILIFASVASCFLVGRQQRMSMSVEQFFGLMDEAPAPASSQYIMYQNDLLLGLQDPFLWWLAPLFVLVSVGVLNVVSLILTALIQSFAFSVSMVKGATGSSIEQAAARSYKRRIITTVILLTFVSFAIPYQFAYVVACLVEFTTCVRLARCADSQKFSKAYNFNFSFLVLMVCVLPINIPILIVWVRNISVQWFTPFSSHHNILSIAPTILVVESLTNGHLFPPLTSSVGKIIGLVMVATSFLICLYGVMYTYLLHHALNIIAGCAFLYHHFANYNSSGEQDRKR